MAITGARTEHEAGASPAPPPTSTVLHVFGVSLLLVVAWTTFVVISLGGPDHALAFGSDAYTAPMAAEHFGADVYVNDEGYDGQYYWATATQLPDLHGAADDVGFPRYRFQRIVTPILASPFGDGMGAAVALLGIGCLGGALGAAALADLARRHGRRAWIGYLFLPPVLFAMPLGLAEPLAYGLGMVGVALVDRRRWWSAAVVLAVAALTRESALLMSAAAVGGVLLTRTARLREVLPHALPFAAVFAWWLVLGHWFDGGPPEIGQLRPFGIFAAGPSGVALGLATLAMGLLGAWLWRDVAPAWPQALAFGLLVLTYEGSLFNWQVLYRANVPAWALGLAGIATVAARALPTRTAPADATAPALTAS